ncbi:MAG: phosphate ABC transporter permease PstA [Alphaproteobacteria bacterium]|nr:phosphate ABC transporter permease PstA [Alphaproteobacteria bacterium]
MSLYESRRRSNLTAMTLCLLATTIGILWLFLILFSLLMNGLPHLSLEVFTEMTPPPGETGGGLLNSIFGTLMMTVLGVGIGAPIGILAGTYLAEYGRYSKTTPTIRFINDILLSAPSIIIGLFIYGIVVVPMRNFSALAGALALAVIVIPVVVRTTEDMLLLVPNTLREAASAMGLPRAHVVWHVAYRAARTGILTGVLLGVARIAGETAPLLFTAFSNNFWSASLMKPIASLPTTINSFINTPDANMKQLAWTGALIVTLAVLGLNIVARILGGTKKQS